MLVLNYGYTQTKRDHYIFPNFGEFLKIWHLVMIDHGIALLQPCRHPPVKISLKIAKIVETFKGSILFETVYGILFAHFSTVEHISKG